MPAGPSIVILKEILLLFKGKKIISVKGNAKIEKDSLVNKKIIDFRSWGKQLFICLKGMNVRIHFLMFGSYSVNTHTKPDKSLRLGLFFAEVSIYFYTCSVKLLNGDLDKLYDWEADVLSDQWNAAKARKKLKTMPDTMVCDALLDQQIFSGVGNIIKNDVLYRIRLHPETLIKNIPPKKITELIKEARNYSFDFLKWKKEFNLKKLWLYIQKKSAKGVNCHSKKYCGKTKRRTFFVKIASQNISHQLH